MQIYCQIPISRLQVRKGKIQFVYEGVEFIYTGSSKLATLIIKNKSKFPNLIIGFSVQNGKVNYSDKLEIIEKRLKLLKTEQNIKNKTKKTIEKNTEDNALGKEKSNKAKEKVKKTILGTRQKPIKISHRFRTIVLNLSNITFKENELSIKIGSKYYTEKAVGSRTEFNKLKENKSITLKSISLKVNNEIAIIDDNTKTLLLGEMNGILNKNKLNKPTNKLNQEQEKSPTSENVEKVKRSIKLKATGASKSSDLVSNKWNLLQFENKYIKYEEKWYKEDRSSRYLNHLKRFFHHKSYSYSLRYENEAIKSIIIPNEVFKLVKLGQQIENIIKIDNSNYKSNSKLSYRQFGLSFHDIFTIFNKDKTFYLESLFKKHLEQYEIICIPEPIFKNDQILRKDISFLFFIGKAENPLVVWESIEVDKATYVFKIDTKHEIKKVISSIESYLLSSMPYKRSNLQSKSTNLFNGVLSIKGIRHMYTPKGDNDWVKNLSAACV